MLQIYKFSSSYLYSAEPKSAIADYSVKPNSAEAEYLADHQVFKNRIRLKPISPNKLKNKHKKFGGYKNFYYICTYNKEKRVEVDGAPWAITKQTMDVMEHSLTFHCSLRNLKFGGL